MDVVEGRGYNPRQRWCVFLGEDIILASGGVGSFKARILEETPEQKHPRQRRCGFL